MTEQKTVSLSFWDIWTIVILTNFIFGAEELFYDRSVKTEISRTTLDNGKVLLKYENAGGYVREKVLKND